MHKQWFITLWNTIYTYYSSYSSNGSNTFINNPPLPASVPQGTSTTLTIDMLVGTPPFNVIVNGKETPIASSSNFNILGMSGTGTLLLIMI